VTASSDRAGEAGVTLIEAVVALLIMATAVIALLGGLGSSIVASDMHRKTVTADAVVRNWAERIQGAQWASCAGPGTPYGAAPVPSASFTGTVSAVTWGKPDGTFGAPQCTPGGPFDNVQALTLVVRATDGRGIARLEIVKRNS
jgi:Tfp pilus assembly protein PilV